MFALLSSWFRLLVSLRYVRNLALENLALRQQLAVMKRQRPRPRLRGTDRLFWVWLSKVWKDWQRALVIVKPETVIAWHRQGFRLFWAWISRRKHCGHPGASAEVRTSIRKMAEANPCWGAPCIHGELLKLGISISERTVSRLLPTNRKRALSDLEDFPRQPCKRIRLNRFLYRPNRHVPGPVRSYSLGPSSEAADSLQPDGESDYSLDRAADSRGLSGRHRTSLPDPRPRQNLRRRF